MFVILSFKKSKLVEGYCKRALPFLNISVLYYTLTKISWAKGPLFSKRYAFLRDLKWYTFYPESDMPFVKYIKLWINLSIFNFKKKVPLTFLLMRTRLLDNHSTNILNYMHILYNVYGFIKVLIFYIFIHTYWSLVLPWLHFTNNQFTSILYIINNDISLFLADLVWWI